MKTRTSKIGLVLVVTSLIGLFVSSSAWATNISVNAFNPGDIIDAGEMNDNFTTIVDQVNTNTTQVDANTTQVNTNTTTLTPIDNLIDADEGLDRVNITASQFVSPVGNAFRFRKTVAPGGTLDIIFGGGNISAKVLVAQVGGGNTVGAIAEYLVVKTHSSADHRIIELGSTGVGSGNLNANITTPVWNGDTLEVPQWGWSGGSYDTISVSVTSLFADNVSFQ